MINRAAKTAIVSIKDAATAATATASIATADAARAAAAAAASMGTAVRGHMRSVAGRLPAAEVAVDALRGELERQQDRLSQVPRGFRD